MLKQATWLRRKKSELFSQTKKLKLQESEFGQSLESEEKQMLHNSVHRFTLQKLSINKVENGIFKHKKVEKQEIQGHFSLSYW